MAFQTGIGKKAQWIPSGGIGSITLSVQEHSWAEMIDKLDVTSSGSGGVQALLASYLKGDGNVKAVSDDSQVITNTGSVNIVAGATGLLNFYHYATGSNAFGVPALITKVNFKSVVAGLATYDFDVSLNSLAGTYVRPS